MVLGALKRWSIRALYALGVVAAAAALLLLARSVEDSAQFSRWQLWILLANLCAVAALSVLLVRKLWQLYTDFRQHVPGSRLTVRTAAIFGSLVIVPLLVVYLFALEFINNGIDSWFRVEIKQGLNDALVLSRSALELRLHEQSLRTARFAHELAIDSKTALHQQLETERRAAGASEVLLYSGDGSLLAVSSSEEAPPMPALPPQEIMLQLASGGDYASLDPLTGGQYLIVTAAPVGVGGSARIDRRFVLARYPVPAELSALAEAVQRAYSQYGDLSALRLPLKYNFTLTLTLVLVLTLLVAVLGAIRSAQRLTQPVQDLIAGTRAVGKGDFGTRLPLPSRDEIGYLVHSFNDMTKRLRRASEEATQSGQAVERERARLAIILSSLSSGVLVVDRELRLRGANQAASSILGVTLPVPAGQPLDTPLAGAPVRAYAQFVAELKAKLAEGKLEWREQLQLAADSGERVLLWACTSLPAAESGAGGDLVVVFEDITALLGAQRAAAWGEVARRLAHEIKNPLTPIQLSAERLRRNLRGSLSGEEAELLSRSTDTIVQQVDAMKRMVNAFSEYARAPDMQITRFNLNTLATEVVELYRLQDTKAEIRLELDPRLPEIEADRGRFRQLLANLITNSFEALADKTGASLAVATHWQPREAGSAGAGGAAAAGQEAGGQVRLEVSDNGPGFRPELLGRVFDPYVTSKARGTGLGLAIVKRIVEEHRGRIEAENRPGGGARVVVTLRREGA